jgi:hypothetical protein
MFSNRIFLNYYFKIALFEIANPNGLLVKKNISWWDLFPYDHYLLVFHKDSMYVMSIIHNNKSFIGIHVSSNKQTPVKQLKHVNCSAVLGTATQRHIKRRPWQTISFRCRLFCSVGFKHSMVFGDQLVSRWPAFFDYWSIREILLPCQ